MLRLIVTAISNALGLPGKDQAPSILKLAQAETKAYKSWRQYREDMDALKKLKREYENGNGSRE